MRAMDENNTIERCGRCGQVVDHVRSRLLSSYRLRRPHNRYLFLFHSNSCQLHILIPEAVARWIRLTVSTNGDYPASSTPRAINPIPAPYLGRPYRLVLQPKGVFTRPQKLNSRSGRSNRTVSTAAQLHVDPHPPSLWNLQPPPVGCGAAPSGVVGASSSKAPRQARSVGLLGSGVTRWTTGTRMGPAKGVIPSGDDGGFSDGLRVCREYGPVYL